MNQFYRPIWGLQRRNWGYPRSLSPPKTPWSHHKG